MDSVRKGVWIIVLLLLFGEKWGKRGLFREIQEIGSCKESTASLLSSLRKVQLTVKGSYVCFLLVGSDQSVGSSFSRHRQFLWVFSPISREFFKLAQLLPSASGRSVILLSPIHHS